MPHPLTAQEQKAPYFLQVKEVDTSWLKAPVYAITMWEGREISEIGSAKNFGGIAAVVAILIIVNKWRGKPIPRSPQAALLASGTLVGIAKHYLAQIHLKKVHKYREHYAVQVKKTRQVTAFEHPEREDIIAYAIKKNFKQPVASDFAHLKIHYPEEGSSELLRCRAYLLLKLPEAFSIDANLNEFVSVDEICSVIPYLISSTYLNELTVGVDEERVLKKTYVDLLLALNKFTSTRLSSIRERSASLDSSEDETQLVSFKSLLNSCLKSLEISLEKIEGGARFPAQLKDGLL